MAKHVISQAERANPNWIISGTLLRMEHHPYSNPAQVIVELDLTLVNFDCRKIMLRKHYQVDEAIANEHIDQAVLAFEIAIAQLINEFKSDLRSVIHTSVCN